MNKHIFFIGIGPPKTGSTWLYQTLQQHPEAQMPPIKELNYFNIEQNIGKVNFLTRLFNKNRLFKEKRSSSLIALKISLIQILKLKLIGWRKLYWLFQYFCLPHDDEWYKKLFPKNKVSGDISPLYSRLTEKTIQKIKHFNPSTKIIIGLRNPVERDWSATKMWFLALGGKSSILEIKESAILTFLKNNSKFSPNNYISLINKWGGKFSENQIFIYYFEELEENPQKLFNRICEFLEIQPIEIENIKKKVNKGIVEEIPAEYEKKLIELNYKYIEEFAEKYPNKYSLAWLEKYKRDI